MAFTLIVGPMKSGKSLELIARVAPYEFADEQVLYVQHKANVRDEGIQSRVGVNTKAEAAESLSEITSDFDVVGIDEIHMFKPEDSKVIDEWLKAGKSVFASGLDLDYSATLTPIMKPLMELKPDLVLAKIAVCEVCKKYQAQFTQILHNNEPVLSGLPAVVPEDGTYEYQARCRNCFVKQI